VDQELATSREPFAGHLAPVHAVAITPDGEELVTAGEDRTARIRDRRTREIRTTLTGHMGTVYAVAVTPDGEEVVTGSSDGTVRVWNRRTGEARLTIATQGTLVLTVAVTPDGQEIISAGADMVVRIWNRRTGEARATLSGHSDWVRAVAVTPDGDELISASDDGTIRIWNRSTGDERAQLLGHARWVKAVAVTPDGRRLVSGGTDRTVRVWDRQTGEELAVFTGHTDDVEGVAVTPDGKSVVSAGADLIAQIWDLESGDPRITLTGHASTVLSVALTPDGDEIVTTANDGTVRVWDARTGEELAMMGGHTGAILALAVAPGGEIVTGGSDRTARVWDRRSGEERATFAHPGSVLAVAVTPDGEEIVTGCSDGSLRIWDPRTGELRETLEGHTDYVRAVAVAPGGQQIVSVSDDATVRLWDRQTGAATVLRGHENWVRAVAVTPDGQELVSAGDDGTVRIWDARTGDERAKLTGHNDWVKAVTVTPDGEEVISVGDDMTVRIWSRRTGEQRAALSDGAAIIETVAVTPDGEEVVTGGLDGIVRIFNRRTGALRAGLGGHAGTVYAVAVTPDSEELVTAGQDGTIRIWNRRRGVQVRGTQLGGIGPARRLAAVRSDEPSAEDLLDWATEVEMLAALVTSLTTEPPLSIALLGEWGSGKSSFMVQMQREVTRLSDLSRNNLGQSVFAATVRQVRFNAWHYSDDHLWVGLIEHLFRSLVPEETDESDSAAVRARRDEVAGKLERRVAERDRLNDQLRSVGVAGADSGWAGALGWPLRLVRLAVIDLKASWRFVLLWAALIAVAVVAWTVLGSQLAIIVTTASALLAPVVRVWTKLRALHERGLALEDRERARLEARRDDATRAIVALRDELATVDAATRLSSFVTQIADAPSYERFRGLVGQVHRDLRRLDENLRAAHGEWASSWSAEPPPLERIVLYIDDLDRCPPRRVVEVLGAVHLLLALPLFVVVVAVDPRWLMRSLEHHHHQLMSGGDPKDAPPAAEGALVSPLDYLDKIFQIPFALRPMRDHGTAYLSSLLGPVAAAPAPRSAPRDGGEERAADGNGQPPPAGEAADQASNGAASGDERKEKDARATEGAVADGRSARQALRDLQPEGLRLRVPELQFIPMLGPLLPTPRAGKKLVNIYRLIRIAIPESELPTFVGDENGGPYQAVLVLLAVTVGSPELAEPLIRRLDDAADGDDVVDLLRGEPGCERIAGVIAEIRGRAPVVTTASEYKRWTTDVARFSFYTRELAD